MSDLYQKIDVIGGRAFLARLDVVVRRVDQVKSLFGRPEFEAAARELVEWAEAEDAPIPDGWR